MSLCILRIMFVTLSVICIVGCIDPPSPTDTVTPEATPEQLAGTYSLESLTYEDGTSPLTQIG